MPSNSIPSLHPNSVPERYSRTGAGYRNADPSTWVRHHHLPTALPDGWSSRRNLADMLLLEGYGKLEVKHSTRRMGVSQVAS
ncbi:hypothetical protein M407DRAFT_157634 [Tulasnella calospora MUT 4182]|uniref:Uncharacterized protein n=1 Tax=Tulasnella calospora MUT 4182 TaxID=1051891 RepID=A0A0C3LAQ6_9AGAM|nr:hypothetical protein M407DRAFT_157634 [Tulasnella calospora MUT 4182]